MQERFERGLELLHQVDGDGGVQVVDSLKDLAPDVSRYIIEFAFGDIYAREGLSLRDRELATIASLCTQGSCEPQLKVHIRGALNAGMTESEVIETFVQLIPYVGFPRVSKGHIKWHRSHRIVPHALAMIPLPIPVNRSI